MGAGHRARLLPQPEGDRPEADGDAQLHVLQPPLPALRLYIEGRWWEGRLRETGGGGDERGRGRARGPRRAIFQCAPPPPPLGRVGDGAPSGRRANTVFCRAPPSRGASGAPRRLGGASSCVAATARNLERNAYSSCAAKLMTPPPPRSLNWLRFSRDMCVQHVARTCCMLRMLQHAACCVGIRSHHHLPASCFASVPKRTSNRHEEMPKLLPVSR